MNKEEKVLLKNLEQLLLQRDENFSRLENDQEKEIKCNLLT
jgi:hypothetical protein